MSVERTFIVHRVSQPPSVGMVTTADGQKIRSRFAKIASNLFRVTYKEDTPPVRVCCSSVSEYQTSQVFQRGLESFAFDNEKRALAEMEEDEDYDDTPNSLNSGFPLTKKREN